MIKKICNRLGIDEKDKVIVDLISNNPDVSQMTLSEKTNLSQPAVGMRIQKLRKKGIIENCVGINFKKVELYFGKVDATTKNPDKIIESFKCCPYFLNALSMSGEYNLCIFFMAPDLKLLEIIVNHHLRSNPDVSNVRLNIMIDSARDFIFPVRFIPEEKSCNGQACKECKDDIDDNFSNNGVLKNKKFKIKNQSSNPNYYEILNE
jgi:DNA-binding Lrp family transcriptional regulator